VTRRLLVNADDFGWTDGHNQAVAQAHARGVLTRASLLCNTPGFIQAVELARDLPELSVGVHLTLHEGEPLIPAASLPNLTRADGSFHDEPLALASLWLRRKLSAEEALLEWQAQVQRAVKAGIAVAHLDSHKHSHLFPPLLAVIIQLAQDYQIPYVRLPLDASALRRGPSGWMLWTLALRARPRLRAAGLRFADHFVGISSSGAMVGQRLAATVQRAPEGLTEVMVHPAVVTPAVAELRKRYRWAAVYRFEEELQALCSLPALPT
jgi:hopanoid biosynthesis associated protein HpnK